MSSCWLAFLAVAPSWRWCCSGDLAARQLNIQPLRSSTKVKIADRCRCRGAHTGVTTGREVAPAPAWKRSAKLHFNRLLNNEIRRSVPFVSSHTAINRRHSLFASVSVCALSPRWSFCYYILELFLWAAWLFIRLTAACPAACQVHHSARYFSPTRTHSCIPACAQQCQLFFTD